MKLLFPLFVLIRKSYIIRHIYSEDRQWCFGSNKYPQFLRAFIQNGHLFTISILSRSEFDEISEQFHRHTFINILSNTFSLIRLLQLVQTMLTIVYTVWTVNDVLSRSTPFFSKGCGSTQKGMDRLKSKGMDRLNKRVWIESRRHWQSTLYIDWHY